MFLFSSLLLRGREKCRVFFALLSSYIGARLAQE